MTAKKQSLTELEELLTLMSKHPVTKLTFNNIEIEMPVKPRQFAATYPTEDDAIPYLNSEPIKKHVAFKEPKSALDELLEFNKQ
jgi:hypothetical protein